MSLLEIWVHNPAAAALGWTLVHSLWEGALVALVLAARSACCTGRGPDTPRLAWRCSRCWPVFASRYQICLAQQRIEGGIGPGRRSDRLRRVSATG